MVKYEIEEEESCSDLEEYFLMELQEVVDRHKAEGLKIKKISIDWGN